MSTDEKTLPEQRQTEQDSLKQPSTRPEPVSELPLDTGKAYSTFGNPAKKLIISAASIAALFSPLSSQIYLPSLNVIAKDLKVSNSQINLSVTTYMVCSYRP